MQADAISVDSSRLAWDKQGGLLPAIVQHADTLQVVLRFPAAR